MTNSVDIILKNIGLANKRNLRKGYRQIKRVIANKKEYTLWIDEFDLKQSYSVFVQKLKSGDQIYKINHYVNGLLDGPSYALHHGKTIHTRTEYRRGLKHGSIKYWNRSGAMNTYGTYVDDVLEGYLYKFRVNDKGRSSIKEISHMERGVRSGPHFQFFNSGYISQMQIIENYQNRITLMWLDNNTIQYWSHLGANKTDHIFINPKNNTHTFTCADVDVEAEYLSVVDDIMNLTTDEIMQLRLMYHMPVPIMCDSAYSFLNTYWD